MVNNSNFQTFKPDDNSYDELDLKKLFSFLLRNKLLIGALSFVCFSSACLFSLTLKRVWEGQFQIVLNSEPINNLSAMGLNSSLNNFIGADQSSSLKTQVGILKSPSVLMPIYDFVNQKTNTEIDKEVPFYKWKNNLNIELQKNTSILNIAYRDKNREIILPALKRMSLIYQDYSGRSIKKSQDLVETYLNNQIKLFSDKSSNSIKAAQNFAIDQNLIYLGSNNYQNYSESISNQNSPKNLTDFNPQFLGSIINIENVRVRAANKIRTINLQLKKINELEPTDYENLQYFGSTIPALSDEGLPQTLKDIEKKLVVLRTQYTENDRSIIKVLEERQLTVDLLKKRAIKYLKASKLEAEATMEAAIRPKDILLKYKELIREAARDEKTLVSLENDLRKLKLQKAKLLDPWKLITKPTLLKNPVAPSRKVIGIVGLLFGFFVGVLLSIYKEKKSNKIYSLEQLEGILLAPFLERINKKKLFSESKQIMFFKEFLKNQNAQKIGFITLEEINKPYLEKLKDYLVNETNIEPTINLIQYKTNLEDFNNFDCIILFSSLEFSSLSEMKTLSKRLSLLKIVLKGYVLLEY